MGLDSVELIVAFEKHFQITIPGQEAEQIGMVGQAATCITRLKGLSVDLARTTVYYTVLEKLLGCLWVVHHGATEATLLNVIWPPGTANKPATLATCLELEVPLLPKLIAPQQPGPTTWLQHLFGSNYVSPNAPDWSACTVADLADWVVAQNYVSLLPKPTTLYEVQRATIGLTSYHSGVDVPEIQLADSFTNDLGMD